MSKNTKKANAALTGLGKTKRIILGDTLIDNYSDEEIETVIAHEFGHFKKKHIIKNIVIGTLTSFLTLFVIAYLYQNSLGWFGFFIHYTGSCFTVAGFMVDVDWYYTITVGKYSLTKI